MALRLVAVLLLAASSRAEDGELDEHCRRLAAFGFSGTVLVARGDEVLLENGYGLADAERGTRNTKDTVFEIASVTKPFTAAAILRLEQDGELKLSDPIAKHLPGVPARFRDITIRHLLTHTSGMPRMGPGGGGDDLGKAVAAYFSGTRAEAAGARAEYWNGGYALLAGIVERVTGKSYMDYCRAALFEPAGMKSTGFTGEDRWEDERLARGHAGGAVVRTANGHPYGSYGWQYRGMGGIVTSIGDLYRWKRSLAAGTVLGEAARKKHLESAKPGYACGWHAGEASWGARKVSHGGSVRGFHAQVAWYPDDGDVFIAVLSNVNGIAAWPVASRLEGLVFPNAPKFAAPPKTVTLEEPDLAACAGAYEIPGGGRLVVRPDGNGLLVGAEGQAAVDLLAARLRVAPAPARFREAAALAARIVEGVAKGDVALLRKTMGEGIPPDWPDRVKNSIWPEQVKKRGALRSVRALGATYMGRDGAAVVLALEHEKGEGRCKVVLQGGRLTILDFDGPAFPATARCLPQSKHQFVRFEWIGPVPPALLFEREGEDGAVSALALKPPLGKRVRCARTGD